MMETTNEERMTTDHDQDKENQIVIKDKCVSDKSKDGSDSYTFCTHYQCSCSGRTFRTLLDMEAHKCSGGRQFPFNIIDENAQDHAALTKEEMPSDMPYQCKICDRGFKTRAALNKHQTLHPASRRFECGICGKSYNRRDTLVLHKRKHFGHLKTRCDICYKQFSKTYDLKKHRKIHMNLQERPSVKRRKKVDQDMPYQCKICKRIYKTKVSLRKHQAGHW